MHELLSIAQKIQAWQLAASLSDAELCRKIPQLGSSKTYKKILNSDFTQLDQAKQLTNYQAALAYLETLNTELPPEPEYDTFSNIQDSKIAVAGAMIEPTIARLVVIEGENGTGKDAVKNALLSTYPESAVYVEANELWKDRNDPIGSRNVYLENVLEALNPVRRAEKNGDKITKFKVPRNANAKLKLVIEELNKRKTLLIINEGHHMGPSALNLTKTLINATSVVIVIECIPFLMAKLVNTNYEEAIQLFGNRLYERVVLSSPPSEEISELFDRRAIKFQDAGASSAAAILAGEAAQFGNWRYVSQVARECWKTMKNGASATGLTSKQFDHARATALKRRIQNKPK